MKILISDLDGTLYPHKEFKVPNQLTNNIKAVKKWTENGNVFAIATARGFRHYEVIKNNLGFDVNFIGTNGASIRYEDGTKVSKSMPLSIFIDLCRFIRENNIDATAATGINNDWVWSSIDCYPKDVPAYKVHLDSVVIADVDSIDPSGETPRIQIFVSPDKIDELRKLINKRNYQASVTSSDTDMLDMVPLNCSKGIAIMEMCDKYGISYEDIIVVGDSENDIPMFNVTKNSYCISHAKDFVLASANAVVDTVEELIEIELRKQK